MLSDARRHYELDHLPRHLYDAIVFHDSVYSIDPVETYVLTNEARSADLYQEFVKKYRPDQKQSETDVVTNAILATEHHFDKTVYDSYTTNILLDLDILRMAGEYWLFVNNNEKIVQEYSTIFNENYVRDNQREFIQSIYNDVSLQFRVMDDDGSLTERAYDNMKRFLETG